jgi:hypothetical protein
MLRSVATRPLLLVLATCALAGCGKSGPSDEQRIRSALAEFERATAAHDYRTLCDRVLAPELIETISKVGLTCELAMQKGFEDVEEPRLTVGAVAVHDDTATAEVRSSAAGQAPSEDTVKLVRLDGGWRIASLSSR